MLIYDTLEQAQMRLNGMIILEGQQPLFVSEVYADDDGELMLSLFKLPLAAALSDEEMADSVYTSAAHRNPIRRRQDDPELNFRIFDIGYINCKRAKAAMYPQRNPNRQQHQGLSGALLNLSNNTVRGSGFVEMIQNVYPDRKDVPKMLEDGWSSVAISQDFAIGVGEHRAVRNLLYRGRVIGVTVGRTFKSFILNEEDAYLGDLLEEYGFPFEIDAVES